MANGSQAPWIGLITKNIREEDGWIVISGLCFTRFIGGRGPLDTSRLGLKLESGKGKAGISFGKRFGVPGPKNSRVNSYVIKLDLGSARELDIQNKLILRYQGGRTAGDIEAADSAEETGAFERGGNSNCLEGFVAYDAFDRRTGHNKNSRMFIHDGITCYLRQNNYNRTVFTVRDTNRYDYPEEQKRIEKARKNAKKLEDHDIKFMYEKHCAKYEESASVLYEKLIDMGCDNAYFVTDTSLPAVQKLDGKYRKNIIEKDSDRHLEYYFAAKKFISTETVDHALQLRIANKAVMDKITTEPLSYVFLQHGPTYMVSLNKELRSGFLKKPWYRLHKTVVSSELEAQHFIELGGMERDDLYITGMAKFDRAFRHDGADKIVIMPTWRRWETNQAREDIRQTNYYKMIRLMFDSVPEELRDRVTVLPHPLMAETFKNIEAGSEDAGLAERVLVTSDYESVLRDCELLITDYSSISYDAYYRGAKVVFYWAEKDECMTHYGEGTHLMLNMDNVFGPVAMDGAGIRRAIEETYGKEQDPLYLERYRKIIEFHDGKNSERIIQHLIKDGVINSES